jgi:DNA-binding NarL/FixJ family response regulator
MSTRVILADDHVVLREGVAALLQEGGFEIIGEAADGHEAIRLARALAPDIAVLDISMPLLNGIDAAREIVHVSPTTRAVMLTVHAEQDYLLAALRAGAHGYVTKTQAATDLIQALEEAMRGQVHLSPAVASLVADAARDRPDTPCDPLTSRERQVLQLLAEGKTTKHIARLLSLTGATVQSYRGRIMRKLDTHTTAGLVRYAVRQGLTQL